MPNISKRYWNKMIPEVRKSFVPRGPRQSPHNRQRDIEETMAVHIAMNEGMSKTQAVTKFIKMNLRDDMEIDQNEVARAVKRIEQQVAGTYQNLLHSPNTERNQKDTATFFAMITPQSKPETATKVLSPKEKALMGTFSKWFKKPAQNDTRYCRHEM
ncbi:MAG: hypothetical protein ABI955_08600 [Nitrospirota bacterium]